MKTVLCASFLAAVGSVSHVAHAGPTASAPGSFNDGNISFVLGIDTSQRVWENSRSYGGTYVGWSQLQYTGNPYFYTQVNGIYLSTHNMLGAL